MSAYEMAVFPLVDKCEKCFFPNAHIFMVGNFSPPSLLHTLGCFFIIFELLKLTDKRDMENIG